MNQLIVSIAGSSPVNLTDWICDSSRSREDASDYLSGSINQGILQSLFPSPGVPLPTVPYHRILESVCAISGDLYSKTGKVVNLFVTGHSLGAGISTILYAVSSNLVSCFLS